VYSASDKYKQGYGGPYDVVWRIVRFSSVWSLESGGSFCVGAFRRNLTYVTVKVFTFNLLPNEIL
jgi:hypothetical protein